MSPAWHWQMFCSPRLIWQVTFSLCVHTSGRISKICKKRAWLLWTCILFKLLLRPLSTCVPPRKPMRNPARKLLTRMRREPSGPVLELQSRLPISPFWEVLQAVQETWERAYCARYQRLPQVRERRNGESQFLSHQKAGKKPNPAKQPFSQLSKKLDKLEKTLKKASKRLRDDSNSDSK